MTDASDWIGRVGASWAEEWRRTDRTFAELTARLLDPAAIGSFASALDIGCGAGELSCELARRHPGAMVHGIDISPQLLEVGRERGSGLSNLAFTLADAARWSTDSAPPPDLIVSRHGVMFFADPVAAFAHIAGQAAPGARLRFSCFRAVAENEWARALVSILPESPAPGDPHAPGPFAFADPDRVRGILAAAGWRDTALEPVDYAMIASADSEDRDTAVADAASYFLRIGPAARALAMLDPQARAEAKIRLDRLLDGYYADGRVALPAAAWIVTASAP